MIFSLGLEMYKYLQIPKNLIKSIFKKNGQVYRPDQKDL